MRVFAIVFGSCLCALAVAQSVHLSRDPNYSKPVDISIKVAPLDEALKQIGKATGTTLYAVSNVQDLKVTIYCKALPEGVLLDKIADVLGLQWTLDGSGARLGFDLNEKDRFQSYVDAEDRLLRSNAEQEVQLLARAAHPDPSATDASSDSTQTTPGVVQGQNLAQNSQAVRLGRMFSDSSDVALSAFWRGDVLTTARRVRGPNGTWTFDESTRTYARYDPNLEMPVPDLVKRGARHLVPYPTPPDELKQLPFAKEVTSWPHPPQGDDLALFAGKLKSPPMHRNDSYTLADQLELFAKDSRIPVVADAFRTPVDLGPEREMTELDWLTRVTEPNAIQSRFSDGVLELRHGGFWRLRRFEIPEVILAPYETRAAKQALSLGDYVSFFGKLNAAQAASLETRDVVLRFDQSPFRTMYPALGLLADLGATPADRLAIPAAQFSQSSLAEFANCGLWGAMLGNAKGGIVPRLVQGDFRRMGVIAEDSGDAIQRNFKIMLGTNDQDGVVFQATASLQTPQ